MGSAAVSLILTDYETVTTSNTLKNLHASTELACELQLDVHSDRWILNDSARTECFHGCSADTRSAELAGFLGLCYHPHPPG